jgi:hypothetical protein
MQEINVSSSHDSNQLRIQPAILRNWNSAESKLFFDIKNILHGILRAEAQRIRNEAIFEFLKQDS